MLRALLLAVALLSASADARPVRVCLIGDSITDGFAPSTTSWGKFLLNLNSGDFGVNVLAESGIKIEVAVSGTSATDRFNRGVDGRNCTHVIFLIGTNDLPTGTTASVMWQGSGGTTGLKKLCERTVAQGAKCILCAITPRGTAASWSTDLGTRLTTFNGLAQAFADGSLIIWVDTYTATLQAASNPPALALAAGGATDGLHVNDAGGLILAQTVQAAVVAAGGW